MRKVKYRRTNNYISSEPKSKYFKSSKIAVKAQLTKSELLAGLDQTIENLSVEELQEVFDEKKALLLVGKHREKGILTRLYKKYLKPVGMAEYTGLMEVYSLVCQKEARDFMSRAA